MEDNGWAFERAGRDELNLSVAGKWSDHHFSFSWREDLQSLHLSSAFDMRISEGVRRQNVADLLMYVNARLWIGHFDLWPEDGTIVFRHAMIFPGRRGQRLAMRGAAQSGAGSLRALLPGLPVRAVGRQDARKRPSPPRCWSAPARREQAVSILLIGAGQNGRCPAQGLARSASVGPVTVVEPKPSPELRKLAQAESHHAVRGAVEVAARKLSVCVVALKPQF